MCSREWRIGEQGRTPVAFRCLLRRHAVRSLVYPGCDGEGVGAVHVQRVRHDIRPLARPVSRLRRVRDPRRAAAGRRRASRHRRRPCPRAARRRADDGSCAARDRRARARSRARRWARARVPRARGRRAGRREVHAPPLGARLDRALGSCRPARHRGGVGRAGAAPRRPARRSGRRRDPGRDRARRGLCDARARPAGGLRDRLGADALRRGAGAPHRGPSPRYGRLPRASCASRSRAASRRSSSAM